MNKHMKKDEPERTNCDVCNGSMERGYSSRYSSDGKLLRCMCFTCSRAETCAEYHRTGVLTTALVQDARLDTPWRGEPYQKNYTTDRVLASAKTIGKAIAAFEREVWFAGGMERLTARSPTSGMSAQRDGVQILTLRMCGRARITIQDKDGTQVTMQGLEESAKGFGCGPKPGARGPKPGAPSMSLFGIRATEDEALSLIERVRVWWREGLRVKEDPKVGVL